MADTDQGDSQEYLVISICDQLYALPSASVDYALPPGSVTPLPFVPDYVLGLISVNERIMPLIELDCLIGDTGASSTGDAEPAFRHQTRTELVVINTGRSRCALHCQRIVASVDINGADISSEDISDADVATELTMLALSSGHFQFEDRQASILEPDRIGHLITPRHMEQGEPGMIGREVEQEEEAAEQSQCLVFRMGEERFALRLDDVLEILDLPLSEAVAGAPEEIEGVQIIRGEVLVVLALKTILGLEIAAIHQSPVIVIEFSGRSYGLRVDEVIGLHSYGTEDAKVVQDENGDIAEVVVDGDDVIALLTPSRLISHDRRARLAPFVPATTQSKAEKEEDKKSVLITMLGNQWIGIPVNLIEAISEICPYESIKTRTNPMVKGALSLKGQILPVLDSEALLGQADDNAWAEYGDGNKGAWIVIGRREKAWALEVSEAQEIIDIPESLIKPVEASQARFIYALANIDGRLLSLVNTAPLESAA